MTDVNVPGSAGLVRLLRGAGGPHERHLNALANLADAGGGKVSYEDRHLGLLAAAGAPSAADIAASVTGVLVRARAGGDPDSELLVPLIRQLGGAVPALAPKAVPPVKASIRPPVPPPPGAAS